jgi:hypothetical protein
MCLYILVKKVQTLDDLLPHFYSDFKKDNKIKGEQKEGPFHLQPPSGTIGMNQMLEK